MNYWTLILSTLAISQPKTTSRCHGVCQTEDLIVQPFDTSEWNDQKTEWQVYINFNDESLKSFDNGTCYGPKNTFSYNIIAIDVATLKELNKQKNSIPKNDILKAILRKQLTLQIGEKKIRVN